MIDGTLLLSPVIFLSVSQFHVFLPWVNSCLSYILEYESCLQQGECPGRGLVFFKLREGSLAALQQNNLTWGGRQVLSAAARRQQQLLGCFAAVREAEQKWEKNSWTYTWWNSLPWREMMSEVWSTKVEVRVRTRTLPSTILPGPSCCCRRKHIFLYLSPDPVSSVLRSRHSTLTKYSKPTHPHISFTQCVNCGACSILIFDTLYLTFSGALQDRIFSYWETLIIWNGVQVQCLAETRAEKVEKI